MSVHDIATAVRRAERVLARRPEVGLSDDSEAVARWQGGLRVVARHASGQAAETDMAVELGGSGDRPSPGWLFRAGLASCLATSIALQAAARGIALTSLDVTARSRSDLRGLLGVREADGAAVSPGAQDVVLHVRIAADGASAEALRALVEESHGRAPVSASLLAATPIALEVTTADGAAHAADAFAPVPSRGRAAP